MIRETTISCSESPFGLTIVDEIPTLWREDLNGTRVPLFSGNEAAEEFIDQYFDIVGAAEEIEDIPEKLARHLFIRNGVEKLLLEYGVNPETHDDEEGLSVFYDEDYAEFHDQLLGELIDYYTERQ